MTEVSTACIARWQADDKGTDDENHDGEEHDGEGREEQVRNVGRPEPRIGAPGVGSVETCGDDIGSVYRRGTLTMLSSCLRDLAADGSTGKAASTTAKTCSQSAYLSVPLHAWLTSHPARRGGDYGGTQLVAAACRGDRDCNDIRVTCIELRHRVGPIGLLF